VQEQRSAWDPTAMQCRVTQVAQHQQGGGTAAEEGGGEQGEREGHEEQLARAGPETVGWSACEHSGGASGVLPQAVPRAVANPW
jgi:hypothetical protein